MLINFKNVSDEETVFELLPEGKALLKVIKCEEKQSAKGNTYWAITYQDKDGTNVYDNLAFTEKTLNRVKKCFSNLGLDVSGSAEYTTDDIIGLYMNAYVKIEDYVDKNGNKKQKNAIDLWRSEKYQSTVKKAPAKPKVEDTEDPF